MILCKYKGFSQQSNTILNGWDNKNPIIYTTECPNDYVTVHDIEGVYNLGDRLFNYNQKRNILSTLFYNKAGESLQNYGTLTNFEKFIGAELFFTPYSIRVPSIFTEEQDILNWCNLVTYTQGTPVQQYEGRALVAENLRQLVGRDYLRKGLMTYSNSKLFGEDCHYYIETYIKYASFKFKDWLTNKVGTEFENNGFSQKTYLPNTELMGELKDRLLTILNFG